MNEVSATTQLLPSGEPYLTDTLELTTAVHMNLAGKLLPLDWWQLKEDGSDWLWLDGRGEVRAFPPSYCEQHMGLGFKEGARSVYPKESEALATLTKKLQGRKRSRGERRGVKGKGGCGKMEIKLLATMAEKQVKG